MVYGTHNALEDPRNESVKILINDELFDRKNAKISVFDSGYLVGDGVWEGIRLHHGKYPFIDQHLNRLWQAAKVVGIEIPLDRKELMKKVHKVVDVNEMNDNVLDYEPSLALFVPDDDPLIFYRALADFALSHLNKQGVLFFEINQYLGAKMKNLLNNKGFKGIELIKDSYGNDRMIKAKFE